MEQYLEDCVQFKTLKFRIKYNAYSIKMLHLFTTRNKYL